LSLYPWELNFGQTVWEKTKFYWEQIWELDGNTLRTGGTLLGHDGNTLGTRGGVGNPSPPAPSKRKKLDHS